MGNVKTGRQAGTRIGLSRDDVLRAALALVDAVGIQGLSMRRLAAALDVEAQSLYNHVASKQALIDGVVDILLGDGVDVPADVEWRTALSEHLRQTRQRFVEHPRAYDLVLQASPSAVSLQANTEQILELLGRAGLAGGKQREAYVLVTSLLNGFIIGERFRANLGDIPPDSISTHPGLGPFMDALRNDSADEYFRQMVDRLIGQLASS